MMIGDYAHRIWRYAAVAATAAIFFGASWFIVATLPPRELVMATGAEGGANYELGIRYRDILAKDGVKLQLQPTAGSLANLRHLLDPTSQVSVGFIQGALPPGRKPRSWSRSAPFFTNRYGFFAGPDLAKAYRDCGADGFR